ncbi:MFS transporter [Ruania alba]|uniref:Predicted arabinose efflux permease, MFS family n=1 Tax=Ruania alba TaxID=648782 RepID=A0A1H5EEI4_9MICO|nr:MFS transporter [Ruania alba]SED89532.1 Predicted arabinose efflux permease, MFS family [Ruania alba]
MSSRLGAGLTFALGLLVLCSFGTWYYGYGVLIEPIARETGWSQTTLTSAYGVALLLVGVGSVLAGRASDRFGPHLVLIVAAGCTVAASAVAASASSPAVFLPGAILTQACVGAVGYYALAHAIIARVAPDGRTRGITRNTLFGALASTVFLPLMAWSATQWGWRPTMMAAGCLVAAAMLWAATLLRHLGGADGSGSTLLGGLAYAIRDARLRRLLALGVLGGAMMSVLLLFQVPAMVEAGLTLGVASALAGARGAFQIAGRLPLPWVLDRVPHLLVVRVCLLLFGLPALLLPFSESMVAAIAFVVLAGIGVGTFSTMESVYTVEFVDARSVGLMLGAYALARGVGSAVGPTLAGAAVDSFGTRTPVLITLAVLAIVAVALVPQPGAAGSRAGER